MVAIFASITVLFSLYTAFFYFCKITLERVLFLKAHFSLISFKGAPAPRFSFRLKAAGDLTLPSLTGTPRNSPNTQDSELYHRNTTRAPYLILFTPKYNVCFGSLPWAFRFTLRSGLHASTIPGLLQYPTAQIAGIFLRHLRLFGLLPSCTVSRTSPVDVRTSLRCYISPNPSRGLTTIV